MPTFVPAEILVIVGAAMTAIGLLAAGLGVGAEARR